VAGPLEFVALADLRWQLEVNVVGQIAVSQAFLPSVKRHAGRIVLMGSIGGRVTTPFIGPYCASKFALEAIADALRVELRPWRVHVALIEPGSIATPIWTKSGSAASAAMAQAGAALERDYGDAMRALRSASAAAARRGRPPEAVAAIVEHALVSTRPRTRYLIGVDARIQAFLGAFLPDRLRDRFLTRVLKLPDARR
jgi:NAD(P)-dependent dehydrogenase (short-subunit alcohol dehydrogenase family)